MNGGRTEEHGAHVGHGREEVDTPVLKHDGVPEWCFERVRETKKHPGAPRRSYI